MPACDWRRNITFAYVRYEIASNRPSTLASGERAQISEIPEPRGEKGVWLGSPYIAFAYIRYEIVKHLTPALGPEFGNSENQETRGMAVEF